jgi:hypothetical protein
MTTLLAFLHIHRWHKPKHAGGRAGSTLLISDGLRFGHER